MKWVERKRDEVLSLWRANKIGADIAVKRLVDLGYGVEVAWTLLART